MAGVYREALWPLGSHRNSPDPSPTSEMTLEGSCGHHSVGHGAKTCLKQIVLSCTGRLIHVSAPPPITRTDDRTTCLDTWGFSFSKEAEPGAQGIARLSGLRRTSLQHLLLAAWQCLRETINEGVSQAHSHSKPASENGLPAFPAGLVPKASEHFQDSQ